MLKMVWFIFHLLFLFSLGVTGEGEESVQLINLYDTVPGVLQESIHTGRPLAVSVNTGEITEISSSVLMAESFLRTHVLAHYPATPITTIVVGNTVLCLKEQEHNFGLVLPALKNIYHSLTRWGLEKDIKVSAAFSSGCLNQKSGFYREDVAEKFVRPLLEFLRGTNSTYSVNPPPKFSPLPDETMKLVSFHSESLKKLGFLDLTKMNVILSNPEERKPWSRKLSSFMDSRPVDPFPARPTPLPKISEPPLHSSIGFSVPANVAKKPHPPQPQIVSPPLQVSSPQPQIASPPSPQMPSPKAQVASPLSPKMPSPETQIASPPSMSFSSAPENPPFADQAPPPSPFTLPPCNPRHDAGGPAPQVGVVHNKLWCVAKPTVPADTLQVAMDYACGDGGADCNAIMPDGNCYSPDSVVAHASYAFNSYWQKNKRNGGTCSFGGTAMLINNDPSYLQCRFVLT
ncbi:unnamed protein product [Prunus armeniaca]|uniref:glucan endo-1,3-beta-D-glucosidase n=1 Tax=Prunus armeniaca TaxID=36596 RepID=A0A6J5XQ63_PRUAR|nr:unnamed protein product [Prunus armeniaca]